MPVFSCGGMRYQQQWKEIDLADLDPGDQANVEATIHRALELGINHIETARGYGSSEQQLGLVLPKIDRERFIFQTKVSPCEDPKEFLESFETSMDRLKLEYIDLFALHGLNNGELLDWAVRKGGCLDVARKLQKEGRVRFVGFSTHGPRDIVVDAVKTDGFDYMNVHWYYIFQRNWPAIEAAAQRDMGVFIISPSDKGGRLYEPPDKVRRFCEPLHPMTFNDLFCLSHPQVHTLSIGAAKPSDFDEHLDALQFLDDPAPRLDPIATRWEDAMEQATGYRSPEADLWSLPDDRTTPGGLNVPMILWLRNLALGWDLLEYAKGRYGLFSNGGHWFAGAKADELDQLDRQQFEALFADSPFAGRVVDLLAETHAMLGAEEAKRLSES